MRLITDTGHRIEEPYIAVSPRNIKGITKLFSSRDKLEFLIAHDELQISGAGKQYLARSGDLVIVSPNRQYTLSSKKAKFTYFSIGHSLDDYEFELLSHCDAIPAEGNQQGDADYRTHGEVGNCSLRSVKLSPSQTTEFHAHGKEAEWYIVLEGLGLTVDDQGNLAYMGPGDIAYYPAAELHALGCPAGSIDDKLAKDLTDNKVRKLRENNSMLFLSITVPNIVKANVIKEELPENYSVLLNA